MKKSLCIISILFCILITACENNSISNTGGADSPPEITVSKNGEKAIYQQISQDEAKRIMDSGKDIIILDVREQDEYNEGHIPGAILLPYTQIEDDAEKLFPDKEKEILLYCRSGRRSKIAAESLALLGYTNVKEFGGITDWEHDIVK